MKYAKSVSLIDYKYEMFFDLKVGHPSPHLKRFRCNDISKKKNLKSQLTMLFVSENLFQQNNFYTVRVVSVGRGKFTSTLIYHERLI